MPKIFRAVPPVEIVERFLLGFGLHGINDGGTFTQNHIKLDIAEQVLPEIEPYYIPCKAVEFLHKPFTHHRSITILRQLLKACDRALITTEKTRGSKKVIWYQITHISAVTSNVEIEFN
jgi:hypothetical protein